MISSDTKTHGKQTSQDNKHAKTHITLEPTCRDLNITVKTPTKKVHPVHYRCKRHDRIIADI